MNNEKIFQLVKASLEELNEELDYSNLRDVTGETSIAGGQSSLDSLSLVRLIVDLETKIERAFSRKILLADENAMSARNSPFRNVTSLVDFIVEKMDGRDG
jgi:acyl carrier protein